MGSISQIQPLRGGEAALAESRPEVVVFSHPRGMTTTDKFRCFKSLEFGQKRAG